MTTINDINLTSVIEIEPAIKAGGHSKIQRNFSNILIKNNETPLFVDYLNQNEKAKSLISNSLQSLCERENGTKLITSSSTPDEFIEAFSSLEGKLDRVAKIIEAWRNRGINEVYIHFVDKRQYH